MEISVSVPDWLKLPMETRIKLRDTFQIKKSQGTWVENNIVRSDGHTHQDLQEAITVPKMQAFVDSTEPDFLTLFHACVEKVTAELAEQNAPAEKPDPTAIILSQWAADLSRMQSQAQSLGMEEHFKLLISKFTPNDDKRIPTKNAQPAGTGGTGKAKEAKQKGTAGRSTKAAKNSDGKNLSNPA